MKYFNVAAGNIPIWILSFDADRFHRRLFFTSGISLPPNVAGSISKRQAEFFFGRLAARLGLESLGVYGADVDIRASRSPLWPDQVIGSITHTADTAAAAVLARGTFSGIGIDVEDIIDANLEPTLIHYVVNADEIECMRDSGSVIPRAALLTVAFSAKESLYKAAYEEIGHVVDFAAARVTELDVDRGQIQLMVTETLSKTFVRGRKFLADFFFLSRTRILTCVRY